MLTICWSAKGGSGTSVTTAALTLASEQPAVAVDLDGELPQIFGIGDPDVPGFLEWMGSGTDCARLAGLQIPLGGGHHLIHRGHASSTPLSRWRNAAESWVQSPTPVFVDAGTQPPRELLDVVGSRRLLVTRQCYLSVRAAAQSLMPIDGVVVVESPGRALRCGDIEMALASPVVLRLTDDPAVARAVDAGLLASRLPRTTRRSIAHMAKAS